MFFKFWHFLIIKLVFDKYYINVRHFLYSWTSYELQKNCKHTKSKEIMGFFSKVEQTYGAKPVLWRAGRNEARRPVRKLYRVWKCLMSSSPINIAAVPNNRSQRRTRRHQKSTRNITSAWCVAIRELLYGVFSVNKAS